MKLDNLSYRLTNEEIDSLPPRTLFNLWELAKDGCLSFETIKDQTFNRLCQNSDSFFATNGEGMINALWLWGGAHTFSSESFSAGMTSKINIILEAVSDPRLVFIMIARPARGTIVVPIRNNADPYFRESGFYGEVFMQTRNSYWPMVRKAIRRYIRRNASTFEL